jgi:hypothetical protein
MRLKRRGPAARLVTPGSSAWVLVVHYQACGCERRAQLPLGDDAMLALVEPLLESASSGNRSAACRLFACLHQVWAHDPQRLCEPAWDAVFRYLAPLAALPATGADADPLAAPKRTAPRPIASSVDR